MAIDTRNERASAMNVASPWRGLLPNPDATIDQADRQQSTFMYAGILASPQAAGQGADYLGVYYHRRPMRRCKPRCC